MKRSLKKQGRSMLGMIAETLAIAQISVDSPARKVFSNPWLFEDIMKLVTEKPAIKFIMATGGYAIAAGNTTEIYSISTNSWRSGPDLPQIRYDHGMALVDVVDGDDHNHREIFIIGGCVDGEISKSVLSLTIPNEVDSTAMKWKVMPNLKVNREGHGVGVVGGKIFVIGGYDGREHLKTIEVFSVKEGKWIVSDDHHDEMITARSDMGVAVIGKKIFVIGGFNRTDRYLSRVEVLDTETNKWSTLPSLETARCSMGITVIDGRFIWIFGGFDERETLETIEIFDVEKNEWSTSSIKLTSPRSGMKAITVDHKIFIIGGVFYGEGMKLVEVLDVDEMKWTTLSSALSPRYWHDAIGF